MKKITILFIIFFISSIAFADNENDIKLLTAVKNNDLSQIKQLIENKADINVKDEKGNTPLMIAAKKRLFSIAKYLISKKPDLNLKNKRGACALLIANEVRAYEIIKLLEGAGAKSLSVTQRIQSGGGFYLTGFGMGVVFLGLILLSLFMIMSMKIFASFREREKRKEILRKISRLAMRRATVDIPYGAENTADVNDEVVAAISLALNLYFTMYETQDEMARLTQIIKINPISPWKIYHRSNTLHRNENRFTR